MYALSRARAKVFICFSISLIVGCVLGVFMHEFLESKGNYLRVAFDNQSFVPWMGNTSSPCGLPNTSSPPLGTGSVVDNEISDATEQEIVKDVQTGKWICRKNLAADLPVDATGSMRVHHWEAQTGKWNELERWKPLDLKAPCTIWYPGTNTDGADGKRLQHEYPCNIHAFEPVPSFVFELVKNWRAVPRSTIHAYGLGSHNRRVHHVEEKGQSTFAMTSSGVSEGVTLDIRNVNDVWHDLKTTSIDLLHVNCEGCEWELFESLLAENLTQFIRTIQWRTHWFPEVEEIEWRYCKIWRGLEQTHTAVFRQPFGWERWVLSTPLIIRQVMKHEERNDVNTIVTAYFDKKSKHSSAEYKQWMSNMLSLQDGMVIFTTPDMVSMITLLRKHALHLTKVVPTDLHQLRMATAYDKAFWERQHSLDPESGIHQSYQLYWIWDEKTEFLKRAVDMNPFNSSFFAWVDIGYFRETKFNGQSMLKRIPSDLGESQMLMLDVNPLMIGAPGYDPKHGKYIGGGFIGGYETGIRKWHSEFYAMLERHKDTFIGKDQPIMWKTCEANPGLCKLVVPDSTGEYGDPWFYMAPYLILLTK